MLVPLLWVLSLGITVVSWHTSYRNFQFSISIYQPIFFKKAKQTKQLSSGTVRTKNPKVINILPKSSSTKLLLRWAFASFTFSSFRKIWKNYLKFVKIGTSEKHSWSPGSLVRLIKQISLSTQAVLKWVFIWQWLPKVSPCLHQPKVQMNDMFTFHDLFYQYECFPKLTTISYHKHSLTLTPEKDVKTKPVLHQQFIQLENYFAKKWPKLTVKLWDNTWQSLGTCLAVQWLGLGASTAVGPGFNPWSGN